MNMVMLSSVLMRHSIATTGRPPMTAEQEAANPSTLHFIFQEVEIKKLLI